MSADNKLHVAHLNDQQLVDAIQSQLPVPQVLVDEYYRRCIPIYLDFIGLHWHTGFYLDEQQDISPLDQARMIDVVAKSVNINEQDRVLDVGCGLGGTALHLARQYNCFVHGLTPVSEQRILAERLVSDSALTDRISIEIGHATQLPYPNNSMDKILFFESPCHFPDRLAFFKEALRVLKPGGKLAGEDWLVTATGELHNPLNQAIARDWAIPALGSGKTYVEAMRSAGFETCHYFDMRKEMTLNRGFAVTPTQQQELQAEIANCPNPLLRMTLTGLLSLGQAVAAGVFTIGRFSADKMHI